MSSALKNAVSGIAFLLAVGGTAHAGVTFISSGVVANGHAQAVSGKATGNGDGSDSDSLPAPGDQDASAVGTAVAYQKKTFTDLADAQAIEGASSSFADASSGTVDFTGTSFADGSTTAAIASAYNELSSFFYTFSVDYKSWLNVNYSLSESADPSLFSNTGSLYDNTTSTFVKSLGGTGTGNTSGSVWQWISPGTYTLYLDTSKGDLVSLVGVGMMNGSHSEHYDFAITPAPEPGMWALMMMSVGLTGLALRLRRRAHALAG